MSNQDVSVKWPAKFNELPKDIFNRPDVFERELERIFYGPEWHPVGHHSEIPNKGDFKTFTVGHRPVMMVRGENDEVRVFLNSCPHRGTTLENCARGTKKRFECPYHRWSFYVDGRLIGVPGIEDFPEDFKKEDHGLKTLRSDNAFGVEFITFSPDAPPLKEYLGEVYDHIGSICCGDGRLKLIGYQKVRYATNWKEYNDNEGYHGPLLHTAFRILGLAGTPGFQMMTKYAHKVNTSTLNEAGDSKFLSEPVILTSRDPDREPRTQVVSLFPMTLFVKHLDVINLRFAFPLSPDETEVHYAYFSHEDDSEDLLKHRVHQSSNLIGPSGLISLEDGAVFSRIHTGSYSGDTAAFQKGVTGEIEAPYELGKGEEAGNLIRWERYRKIMGFERVQQ